MVISNPSHWKEPFYSGKAGSPRYDKIVEMIGVINGLGGIGNHASTHEDSGADEISVTGLSGLLADDQHVIDSEVEAVITAELVDGESIDLAIDTLIATHKGLADDHHAQTHNNTYHSTNYEPANANIQAHVASPVSNAHHTRYADSEAETVIIAELVNGQSIDLAIDTLIATHKGLADDHHAQTHNNTYHSTSYEAANANIQGHVASPATNAHHNESHVLAVTGPHTGTLPLADLAVGSTGSLIRRGATDWEELIKANDSDVLTLVSGYPAWVAQGAPGAHASTHQDSGVDEISVAGLSGVLTDNQPFASHNNTKHSTNYMPEIPSGKRILLKRFSLGHEATNGSVSFNVTATSWTHYGNIFAMGKDQNWFFATIYFALTGWSIKFTFSCRANYQASNTVYVRLYNRSYASYVAGSELSMNTGQTTSGFGQANTAESGYITQGSGNLATNNHYGYNFRGYNSAASKSVHIFDCFLNCYLVKD